MDPISNKKEFEDLTANLRDLAYSYIEKYNPSKQQINLLTGSVAKKLIEMLHLKKVHKVHLDPNTS